MEKINNYEIYNYRMKKSLLDKMFFLDKFFEPIETIVDFGCADGELILEMNHLFPDYKYIGYDISEEMLNIAKSKNKNIKFCNKWEDLGIDFEKSLLNISSTIHEVYSYSTKEEINTFLNNVFKSGFKYICVRDMMLSNMLVEDVKDSDVEIIREKLPKQVKEYEEIWGSLKEKKNFVHFLLKYKYVENWNREVKENYFPISVEEFLSFVPDNYRITYSEHYTLPYTAHQVKSDFGIILDTKTHFKLILKRIDR